MTNITWASIMSDPTTRNLAKRINKRYLFMSEADILYLFEAFENANRIKVTKEKSKDAS